MEAKLVEKSVGESVGESLGMTARSIRLLLGVAAPALGLVLAFSTVGCTSLPSPPSSPAYDTDVRPIFLAHCTRCHGDGPGDGALNIPTELTGHDAGSVFPDAEVTDLIAYERIFLTQFKSSGNCITDASSLPADCHQGAQSYARSIPAYVKSAGSAPNHMPPPPAPELNDWEIGVLDAWSTNPVCSHAANPDPTICPPGS